jgi:hypothetical protein
VEFYVDDITSPWVYPHRFDYIHSRAVSLGIKDWTALIDQSWQNLEPGRWVEFQEYHVPSSRTMVRWGLHLLLISSPNLAEGAGKAGMKLDAILGVPDKFKERGFVSLGSATTQWPVGPWAKGAKEKRIGRMMEKDLIGGAEAFCMRLNVGVLGWKEEDVKRHVKEVITDIQSRKAHRYVTM